MFYFWEFPGDPVVRTRTSIAKGPGSVPGWGTKILHAVQRGQKQVTLFSGFFHIIYHICT